MKRILFSIALLAGLSASAQKIKVTESNESVGGGSHNALVVSVYETAPDIVEKEWKSVMKDYDAKVSSKDGGLFGDNALFKAMGPNTVDIYSKVVKVSETETKLIVAYDLGGAYLNSKEHNSQYDVAKDIMHKFATKISKESVADQVKAATKVLDKLNDQQKDLVDDQTELTKNIADWKEKIRKAEEAIVKNKADQDKKKTEIAAQQKVVDAVIIKQKGIE